MNKHWSEVLQEAVSDFEYRYPKGLKKLSRITSEDLFPTGTGVQPEGTDDETVELYQKASMCIVEPDQYLKKSLENHDIMKEYHDLWDNATDINLIGASMQYIENKDWLHIYELVIKNGY